MDAKGRAPGHDLVVNVADLVHRPGARRHERVEGRVGPLRVIDVNVAADATAVVDVMLECVSDGILVTGKVDAPWQGDCRRCLRPVEGAVSAAVRELFEERFHEGESYPLRHSALDLGLLAREALLLELPLAPVCSDDCRGLCPECGVDLNREECGCRPAPTVGRWAALDALRVEGE